MANSITTATAAKKVGSIGRVVTDPIRRRGVRLPEVAIGLTVMVASIAVFTALGRDADSGRRILVTARDIAAGSMVTADDIRAVEVSTSESLALLPDTAASQIVGMRVSADLRSGTPLSAGDVVEIDPLGPTDALVGIVVGLQQASADIRPGDVVSIVVIDRSVDGLDTTATLPVVASVWSVSDPNELMDERAVSLRVPLDSAPLLIGHDEIHLVKVGE